MMGECMNMFRTGWAQNVPVSYKFKSKERGNVEHIEYETIDYTNNRKIIKQAEIYLPFGYDENEKYNVFYLMHGWTGHAGDFFEYSNILNILDNMILNNDIEPLMVAATFDAENRGQGWSRSVEELEPFHLDFENALMPYVESHYSTYARSTSKEDLIASRDHRAFGGFSLGAIVTCTCSSMIWNTLNIICRCPVMHGMFQHSEDYIILNKRFMKLKGLLGILMMIIS